MDVDDDKALLDVDTFLALETAARKLFVQADTDSSNSLDRSQLECVVRDLARANRRYMTNAEVADEVGKCIATFGNGTVVMVEGFIKYAVTRNKLFGSLDLWKDVFNTYTSRGANGLEMYHADARRLVTDVLRCNSQSCAAENVEGSTQAMLAVADSNNDGSISFAEFVKYATDERFAHMFQKLCAAIRSPQKAPAAAGGVAAGMPDLNLDDAAMDDWNESAARKLFQDYDRDKNGTLDRDELRQVIRILATANGKRLLDAAIDSEVEQCFQAYMCSQKNVLKSTFSKVPSIVPLHSNCTRALAFENMRQAYAGPSGINADNFELYVASKPEYFGRLTTWLCIFKKYAGPEKHISEGGSVRLVQDVFKEMGQDMTQEQAVGIARQLFQEADVDSSGTLSFQEFVTYAQTKPDVFGKLEQRYVPAGPVLSRDHAATKWISAVFTAADKDRGGRLEANELAPIIRDLAAANGQYLNQKQIDDEIQKCLTYGEARPGLFAAVNLTEFLNYVDTYKDEFEQLWIFKTVFNRYQIKDTMPPDYVWQFVFELYQANNMPFSEAEGRDLAHGMLRVGVDGDCVSFSEFVKFMRSNNDIWKACRVLSERLRANGQ